MFCDSPDLECLKVVSATFLLVCFLSLNESTCQTRKNVFCFALKALFVLEKIKFLSSTFSNFMTSSSALALNKNTFHWINWEVNTVSEIWPVYVTLQKKKFRQKIQQKLGPENYFRALLCLQRIKHNLY